MAGEPEPNQSGNNYDVYQDLLRRVRGHSVQQPLVIGDLQLRQTGLHRNHVAIRTRDGSVTYRLYWSTNSQLVTIVRPGYGNAVQETCPNSRQLLCELVSIISADLRRKTRNGR